MHVFWNIVFHVLRVLLIKEYKIQLVYQFLYFLLFYIASELLYVTSYPCSWKKYLSAKTTKYILKCWERSVKRRSNTSFRVIKNSSFDQRFLMVKTSIKTFLKTLWWRFLVPRSEHLLVSSATLSCKTQNILTLSMLVHICYNTNIIQLFSRMFLTYALTAGLFQFINNQGFKWTSFWSFIVSCCFLILLLPNIVSSEELFRYGTSISRYV